MVFKLSSFKTIVRWLTAAEICACSGGMYVNRSRLEGIEDNSEGYRNNQPVKSVMSYDSFVLAKCGLPSKQEWCIVC